MTCPFCGLNHPVIPSDTDCSVSRARKVKNELETVKNEQVSEGILKIKKELEIKSEHLSEKDLGVVINKILSLINLL
tara:strand:- start:2696 stop:2926 length:231 start_codon:yes stop_codon:yes gene_type:complete